MAGGVNPLAFEALFRSGCNVRLRDYDLGLNPKPQTLGAGQIGESSAKKSEQYGNWVHARLYVNLCKSQHTRSTDCKAVQHLSLNKQTLNPRPETPKSLSPWTLNPKTLQTLDTEPQSAGPTNLVSTRQDASLSVTCKTNHEAGCALPFTYNRGSGFRTLDPIFSGQHLHLPLCTEPHGLAFSAEVKLYVSHVWA